jgi:hypothetical protein
VAEVEAFLGVEVQPCHLQDGATSDEPGYGPLGMFSADDGERGLIIQLVTSDSLDLGAHDPGLTPTQLFDEASEGLSARIDLDLGLGLGERAVFGVLAGGEDVLVQVQLDAHRALLVMASSDGPGQHDDLAAIAGKAADRWG